MFKQGLIGKKIGMTRIFTPEGISIPISIIQIENNIVTQIKNKNTDGYHAVQVTLENKKKIKKINKSILGHFIKANVKPGKILHEFRLPNQPTVNLGQIISIDILNNTKKINITGTSKGKGFAGTVKRWNFHMQDASHGNSLSHRAPGSIGQNQTPGKVFKGKKMAGHLGCERVTVRNISIIQIDIEKKLLLVKGGIPGNKGNNIIINPIN